MATIEEKLEGLQEEIREEEVILRDLEMTVMGPPPLRENGIRGDLKRLREEVDGAIKWANDIWNVKRREECLGLAECIKVEKRIMDRLDKEEITMVAKLNLKGVYVMGFLQFIGTIIVALIASGAFKK